MPVIKSFSESFKSHGVKGVVRLFKNYFFGDTVKPIKESVLYQGFFNGKRGIEIGGPSDIFRKQVPIYPVIAAMDGCNFSNSTLWEGQISEGESFNYFEDRTGHQYICEASDLKSVKSGQYDFLVASHCLEHCANTFKTVKEWLRVVKTGGAILLILPDKRFTFDHKRPTTTLNHLIEDDQHNVDETDLTHLDEILTLHDLSRDKWAGSKEEFARRSIDNIHNRSLHHHVFDFDLLKDIYAHFNIKIIDATFAPPYHQIILGSKQ